MTSILKVSEIQDPTNSNTAISIDAAGNVTAPNLVMPAGSVVQVVNSFLNSQVVVGTNTTFTIATINFTPKSATSKILLQPYIAVWQGGNTNAALVLTRNGGVLSPDPAPSIFNTAPTVPTGGIRYYDDQVYSDNYDTLQESMFYIDSPSTTSQVTYVFSFKTGSSTGYINCSSAQGAAQGYGYGSTGLVITEIAQ
jgi:hypothetical protein